tara:strand:- start:1333 stop:2430 length:1098 start_codon:yes stop_codon:yes gene_type:complete
MSGNFYSVGLQNVGSYQVSGRPWLKDISLSLGTRTLLEFPNVTNQIEISNDLAGNGATSILDVMFCEPRRAVDMSNSSGASDYYLASISATYTFSTAMWVQIDPVIAIAPMRFISIEGADIELRVQLHSAPSTFKFLLFDKGVPTSLGSDTFTFTPAQGQWIHMAITVSTAGDFKLYFNGSEVAAFNYNHVSAGRDFNVLHLGDDSGVTFEGVYDEISLFSSDLSAAEVSEIYNSGNYYDSRKFSGGANLLSFWDFEDNNYKTFYTSADTVGTINDRVGSSNLVFQGGNNPSFVDGRLIQNAEARHKIQLVGGESITLQCKTKQILLSCPDGHAGATATDLAVCTSLTGIPANRMFELSGTGIDE